MIVLANDDKATAFLEAIKDNIDKAAAKSYAMAHGKAWNKGFIEVIINQGMKDEDGKSIEKKCHVVSLSAGQDPRGMNINNIRPKNL